VSTTYPEAKAEIYRLFTTYFTANAVAASGLAYIPEIRYAGVLTPGLPATPPKEKHWCRISTQLVTEEQDTLSTCVADIGRRRYTAAGLVFVQMFAPATSEGTTKNDLLAHVAKLAFRGKTADGGIWFRNARVNELKPEESFFRLNVVAEFEFNEIG